MWMPFYATANWKEYIAFLVLPAPCVKTNSQPHQSLSPITGEKNVEQMKDSGKHRFASAASDSLALVMKSKPTQMPEFPV